MQVVMGEHCRDPLKFTRDLIAGFSLESTPWQKWKSGNVRPPWKMDGLPFDHPDSPLSRNPLVALKSPPGLTPHHGLWMKRGLRVGNMSHISVRELNEIDLHQQTLGIYNFHTCQLCAQRTKGCMEGGARTQAQPSSTHALHAFSNHVGFSDKTLLPVEIHISQDQLFLTQRQYYEGKTSPVSFRHVKLRTAISKWWGKIQRMALASILGFNFCFKQTLVNTFVTFMSHNNQCYSWTWEMFMCSLKHRRKAKCCLARSSSMASLVNLLLNPC